MWIIVKKKMDDDFPVVATDVNALDDIWIEKVNANAWVEKDDNCIYKLRGTAQRVFGEYDNYDACCKDFDRIMYGINTGQPYIIFDFSGKG